MSVHKSLISGGRLKRQRNVLTRWERIERLKEGELWEDGQSVFSLPKVKVAHHKRHKKVKKEVKETEAEGAEAAEGAPGETEAAPVEEQGK